MDNQNQYPNTPPQQQVPPPQQPYQYQPYQQPPAPHRTNVVLIVLIVLIPIILIVVCIVAALVITTFSGVSTKARDTERQTDIKSIQGQLEAYFAQNTKYPSLMQLNSTAFRNENMKGLDPEALRDPRNTSFALVQNPQANAYSYTVSPSNCDNIKIACTSYQLTATTEAGGTYIKKALN